MKYVDAGDLIDRHREQIIDEELKEKQGALYDVLPCPDPRKRPEQIHSYTCVVCGHEGVSSSKGKKVCGEECRHMHQQGVLHNGKLISKQEKIIRLRKEENLSVSAITRIMGYTTTQRVTTVLRREGCVV